MSLFKCKMCGGTLEFAPGDTVATCEYCGTKQTLPRLDDDKRANLYDRANHFRRNNEFDKAAGIYEQILSEDNTDAEAYWSLVLCRYGIEYVEDPQTHKRIPTVNRAQYTSIFDDEDYKSAIANADAAQREVYESEAKTINEIQKGILAISQKEEPFDVFICYKETDENGRRTPDSVLANDLYHQLTGEGFKVFFARITLEDKLGSAYEPYIFAALNSAKVMVVLGTKPAYFNAVWVKNEWSRYLALIKGGAKKILIPAYKDMDPYDLPEEFSHLQAQDMSKLGFMQDLIRGIKKLTGNDAPKARTVVKETVVTGANASTAPLLKRAFMFLEDGNWQEADAYCEKVLDQDPECAEAYLGKLMAERNVKKQEDLADLAEPFDGNNNYQKAVRFGNEKLASTLKGYIDYINARNEEARLADIYKRAMDLMKFEWISDHYNHAAELFRSIPGYKDADALAEQCAEKAATAYMEDIYDRAQNEWKVGNYEAAIDAFKSISGFRDADEQQRLCERAYAEKQAADEARAKQVNKALAIFGVFAAVVIVFTILYVTLISPALKRSEASKMLAAGDYANAYAILHELGDDDVISESKYNRAIALLDAEQYDEAYTLLQEIDDNETITGSKRSRAQTLLTEGKYDEAYALFKDIGDDETISESKYERAIALLDAGQRDEAYALLREIDDSKTIAESQHDYAEMLLKEEKYDEAYSIFTELGDDEAISESKYNRAVALLDVKQYDKAYALLHDIGDNKTIIDSKRERAKLLLEEEKYVEAYTMLKDIGEEKTISKDKKYACAKALLDVKRYNEAYTLLQEIGDSKTIAESKRSRADTLLKQGKYDEAYTLLKEIGDEATISESKYNRAMAWIDEGKIADAYETLTALNGYKDSTAKADSIFDKYKVEKLKVELKAVAVRDRVFFGAYEQDNNISNGKEKIEWLVLEKENNRILVISDKVLDCKQYNTSFDDVTWATCSLRKWLNGTFLNTAFGSAEQAMIADTSVSADINPQYSTDPGNATTDKVFLLSINEVNRYFDSDGARKCVPTAYAIANGASTSISSTKGGAATCLRWLRSPGRSQVYAAGVDYDGSFYYGGISVVCDYVGARPALWINLGD